MKKAFLFLVFLGCLTFECPVLACDLTEGVQKNYIVDDTVCEIVASKKIYTYLETKSKAGIVVSRQVLYKQVITPDGSIHWNETINGVDCSGTLYLESFYYSSGNTVVTYKGTLYPKEF